MNSRRHAIAAAAVVAFALSTQASAATSAADQAFARTAAQGGLAEVALAGLATTHAASSDVKAFAVRMEADHGAANRSLEDVASKNAIALPSAPSAAQQATAKKLAALDGDAFDRAYLQEMVKDHADTAALFRKESSGGSNPDLRAFAQKTLPSIEMHLDMAQQLAPPAAHAGPHSEPGAR